MIIHRHDDDHEDQVEDDESFVPPSYINTACLPIDDQQFQVTEIISFVDEYHYHDGGLVYDDDDDDDDDDDNDKDGRNVDHT